MKVLIFLLSFFLLSCSSEHHPPTFLFESEFDSNYVDALDEYAKNLAKEKGFRVYEKSRSEMKAITNGTEAFYVSFYIGEVGPIFVITNAGFGSYINVDIYVDKGFDYSTALKLSERVNADLNELFNIKLKEKKIE
jgi:hypothetical protein